MSQSSGERPRESLSNTDQISPLSNRFLIAHSSPVHDSTSEIIPRLQDDSFQSSSSTSNSKSGSSTTSRSSRLQFLMMQHQSAVNSPLMYSRCTSLGSLASYDIRSSCNDSYTSECSSVKPSGLISPSDIPDSPPCEPEIIEEDYQRQIRPINRTLTMNTTSSQNRTTMMGETVIEKTFVFNQSTFNSNQHHNDDVDDNDVGEHLDEIIVYNSPSAEINPTGTKHSFYDQELLLDDDSCRQFNIQTDALIADESAQNESFYNVPLHENLSVIAEESSFTEDDTHGIKILYDLIRKPHWTKENHRHEQKSSTYLSNRIQDSINTSFSSSPSSLSLNSNYDNPTDDEDEYDQEKGRQLIQRLIEETLARRFLPTDFLHSTSCVLCPSNTPMTTATRSLSSSSSSSLSASTKSCTCLINKSTNLISQPQRSQSSPARPSSVDETKRQTNKQKENTVNQTRSSFLRLRQAQQNKRIYKQDKRS